MKGFVKTIAGLFVIGVCATCFGIEAGAATGIYVGKDVSAEGTTIIGVSSETEMGFSSVPVIIEKGVIRKGDVIETAEGYKYTMPEDNVKMLLTHLMSYSGHGKWNLTASNEYGVSVMTAVNTFANEEAIAADPLVEDGICDAILAEVLVSTSKTAKEAVDTLCSIYDESGADAPWIIIIADSDGAWVVENFTGHQYVATKLPDDKMATFGYEPMIRTADPDDENTICSPELFSLPEKNNFAVYDADKNLDLILTYNYGNVYTEEAHLRGWIGHDIFAPSEELEFDPEEGYDVFFTPDEDVSIKQAFDFFRNRFEGTAYDLSDEDNRNSYWGINNQTVANVNIVQIFDDVPADLGTVLWTTPGNPTASPYIPIPVCTDCLPDMISTDIDKDSFADGIIQVDFAVLNNNVVPRRNPYGKSVAQYWHGYESLTVDDVVKSVREEWNDAYAASPEKAVTEIDGYVNDIVTAADENCKRLSNELEWYLFRSGIRSGSVPDDELEPFECSFDAVAYADANGWETSIEGDVFTATKDGKTIEVVFDGDDKGNVTFTGFDNKMLKEDFEADDDIDENGQDEEAGDIDEEVSEADTKGDDNEPEAKAEKSATDASAGKEEKLTEEESEKIAEATAQKVEVDTIAALGDYFTEKIASVPRNGWAENEISEQLGDVSVDVADIVIRYFNIEINDMEDIMNIDKQIDAEGLASDPKILEIQEKLVATGDDLAGLLNNYFNAVYEDVSGDVVSGRLTQEGAIKILNEAETDVEGFVKLYTQAVFGQVFDTNLSAEEVAQALSELGEGAAQIMEDYGILDLESLGLGDMSVKDLTQADIDVVITLNEMDDDVIDGLSELLGVDVRSTLDMYIDQINKSTPDAIKVVEENHTDKEAYATPDEEIKAVIELEEELREEDIEIPQEVIDILNEAIKEAQSGNSADEASEDTDDAASASQYTINIGNVYGGSGKVMLPAYMLKYFPVN